MVLPAHSEQTVRHIVRVVSATARKLLYSIAVPDDWTLNVFFPHQNDLDFRVYLTHDRGDRHIFKGSLASASEIAMGNIDELAAKGSSVVAAVKAWVLSHIGA